MNNYLSQARTKWDQARRKAFWQRVNASLRGKDSRLANFEEVSQRLRLRSPRFKGSTAIPLNKIVGSVGRYGDFVQAFLPVTGEMQERWSRIAAIYLDPNSPPLPPIEVYKVGDAYFVKDGNHRVSVANHLGLPDIDAYVYEYPLPVQGYDECDIDSIILEVERQDFLKATQIDLLRPNHGIEVTVPGGYLEMLCQIEGYQSILDQIDEIETPLSEAVTAWYDMIYETTVQIVEEMGVLTSFPERTPADVFVWMHRHQKQLEERYGNRVRVTQIAKAVEVEHSPVMKRLWKRLVMRFKS